MLTKALTKKANTFSAYWLFSCVRHYLDHLASFCLNLFTVNLDAISEATTLDTGRLYDGITLTIEP